ncbi:MAG TPA: ABC-type transport auxiliary lipoprotein family protein [Thermoanaerobaculia bacterium]|nr:ABC-type transport auxiliary lipoprotein family protein [Thermoanaerobaculia bacterium]
MSGPRAARGGGPARIRTGLAAAGLSLALGCGSGVPIRYYTLDVPTAPPSAAARAEVLRVGVAPFLVDAPYDQDRIAYRPPGAGHEIAFYHYHRWAVPLSRSLQAGLAEALDALDGVAAEPARPGATYDAVLIGRLWRLEEVDESAESVRVVVEMEVGRADRPERHALRLEAPVAERTLESVVAAFAATLREAARRVAEEVLAP